MGIVKQISNLARHSAIYSISTIFQKLPGFLLLPIYTNLDYIPSRSDFGDFNLIYTFIAFMSLFFIFGMDSAMLRFFFLGKSDRKTIFASTFYIILITGLLSTGLIILFSSELANVILKDPSYSHFFKLAGLILFFDVLGNLPYHLLRAEEKSLQYSVFRGIRFSLELGFNILFVVVLHYEVIGILYTSLAASIVNLLIMLPIITRYISGKIDFQLIKEMLKFGLPFLPNGIAFITIELIDKFIIQEYLGKDAVGLYGSVYKFGAILMLIISAFRNAWQPFFLKAANQENAKAIYSKVLSYYIIGTGWIVLAITLFIYDILTFNFWGNFSFLGKMYWEGIQIIPIILLSYFFYGIYVILTPGFYIKKASQYMILFTGSGAIVNIISNMILLPALNNIWGAAWATLISYFTLAFTIYLVSNKIYPINIEWRRITKMLLLMILVMGIYYFFDPGFMMRLLLVAFSFLFCIFGIIEHREREIAVERFKRLKR